MSHDDIGGAVLRGGPAVVVPTRPATRIPGLDAARGLAILGMLAAHTLPGDGDAFYDGRSSILFATLAGISLGLMSGGDHPAPRDRVPGSPRTRIRLSIAIRALLLIALGLSLWLLGTNIAIILDSYGFFFLVCIPLLFTNRWVLAALALLCALVGPTVVGALTAATSATGPLPVAPDNPVSVPLSWLDAYYPAPVWLAYVLAGLAIARFGVTRPAVQRIMIIGGTVVAALGYGVSAAIGDPVRAHTDTTMEAISSGGLVIAVIGVLVIGVGAITSRRGRILVRPIVAAGSMPLTIYTAQVLVIALIAAAHPEPYDDAFEWTLFVCLAVGSLVFATAWSARFSQGPLEWLFARLTLRRPWRTPRSGPCAAQRGTTPTR
ncbi:hypothetical protein ASF06_05655 [Agreia sp. Leaf244]|uniref:DUF418 domain-containing protein n=1 Tax=Agreia sp. Leaf244 TaxID=1736305 RepID=UPI00070022C3|nr:DUF418 domain-containing protein [Agreia sp. Leaf244]KQO09741.1 hypothetical protein ASF06_05655 [Agreia sp. Leaf244]